MSNEVKHSLGGAGKSRIQPDYNSQLYFFECGTECFMEALKTAMEQNPHRNCVSLFQKKEYDRMALFVSMDRCSGFAIDAQGMICSLFSWKGLNRGHSIVREAVKQGGWKLECFEGFLSEMYSSHGFVVVHRERFNDDYRPASWNDETDGRPNYVHMERVGL